MNDSLQKRSLVKGKGPFYYEIEKASRSFIDQLVSIEPDGYTEYITHKASIGRCRFRQHSKPKFKILSLSRSALSGRSYSILEFGETELKINNDLKEIAEIIDDSEYLLYLEREDDEYLDPSKTALYHSVEFLSMYANAIYDKGYKLKVPKISPSKNGSIELEWLTKSKDIGLIVNFGVKTNQYSTFYGFTEKMKKTIKGSNLSLNSIETYFMEWLINNLANFQG